jgi:hypothetical protein
MACTDLTAGLDPTCAALKKIGGVDRRVWIGELEDISDLTISGHEITAITLTETKTLKKFIGRREKNSAGFEVAVGENANIRTQNVNLVLYHKLAADKAAIDELIDVEGAFVFAEEANGSITAWGIDTTNYENFGLKCSAGTGTTGTVLNDPTASTITLSGGHTNMELVFDESATTDANIAVLDALSA